MGLWVERVWPETKPVSDLNQLSSSFNKANPADGVKRKTRLRHLSRDIDRFSVGIFPSDFLALVSVSYQSAKTAHVCLAIEAGFVLSLSMNRTGVKGAIKRKSNKMISRFFFGGKFQSRKKLSDFARDPHSQVADPMKSQV